MNNNEPFTGRGAGWIFIAAIVSLFLVSAVVFLANSGAAVLIVILVIVLIIALVFGFIEAGSKQ